MASSKPIVFKIVDLRYANNWGIYVCGSPIQFVLVTDLAGGPAVFIVVDCCKPAIV